MGGRADVHDVHIIQHGGQIRVELAAIFGNQDLGFVRGLGDKPGDLGTGLRPARGVGRSHEARADNSDTHGGRSFQ